MRRSFTHKALLAALAAVATEGFSSAALAHVGDHSHMSFAEGLTHPFTGIDHMLAMIAVGLWASQIGGRALWLLPLTFPVVMAIGAALGFEGAALPWVEIGIAASVLLLGALVALKVKPSLAVSVPLIGLFALLHGYSHGVELPASASALSYGAGFIAATLVLHGYSHGVELPASVSALTYAGGFVAATLALHLIGIGLGLLANRLPARFVAQSAGGAIALAGVALLIIH